ncbi:L-cystine-binding protein FliY [Neobacillus rhizosphaerae]|uniref:L-cystine-binding protein FliY n=1 Tax=Neobacillus rhizosphaerae TaxID=2880965 RepID=A0ABN8KRQ1_9BACI|nr:transporter substrate-binding domain-containing protein [Neobacillus rhizosphaerae]CAH2716561.1 L-cystine-binding protein FliY [Neobacillus rhizosphaerae]
MKIKQVMVSVIVGLMMLLAVTACGKDSQKTTAGADKEIRIAVTEASPPFSYFNKDNKLEGFDVDYANEVGKRLNRDVKLISTAWEGILPGLLAKKYDLIIGSMAITEKRKESVNFSDPYYVSGAAIVVHKDNQTIHSPKDLKGKNVGVTLGTTYEEAVNKLGANTKTYNTEVDQLTDLENKRIDAMVTDKFIGAFTIKETKRPLKLLDSLLYEEQIGVAIRKEDKELLKQVNKAIKEINSDGTYEKLAMKHFGTK